MTWRILTGGLTVALVLFLAGCDNCCRKTVPVRASPCCPPGGGGLVVPAPPPSAPAFSGYQPAKFQK